MLVEMCGITKRFPGVVALENVSMRIQTGETRALLGENGAGKSTLVKILCGVYSDYEGEMKIDGQVVTFRSERDALERGIVIVPQELNSVPELTVAENIYLGREPVTKLGFVDKKKRLADAKEFMVKLGLGYEPTAKMSQLSVAQRQMVEIIKAISRNAKLIVMDEPTSALTNAETEYLFQQISRLKREGIAIVFISHKLDEVYKVCDTTTVLRDGKWIGEGNLQELSEDELIKMMVGREVKDIFPPLPPHDDTVVFEAENLCGNAFRNISFSVKKGEILGFAGMMGAGRTEIARAIFGMDPFDSGTVKMHGKPIAIKCANDAIRNGIVMISEDRAIYGFVGTRSIRDNIGLPNADRFCKNGFVKDKELTAAANDICRKLRVKAPSIQTEVRTLSGGNQQKVVLSKWLVRDLSLLILDEPTRGIDVGAKQEIYKLITELAAGGMAIILISSELPEVLSMSHRIMVLAEGNVAGEFTHAEATQDKIMRSIVKKGSEE